MNTLNKNMIMVVSIVKVPDGTSIVYIEAHDKMHGWTPNRLKMDPGSATSGRLNFMAK